jgi:non-homologous end joining protein Ku
MSAKIKFTDIETKEEIDFNVIEETRVNNINYLLVTENIEGEEEDEEETAYILKDLSSDAEIEARYVIVEEDEELEYISKIFQELLDDVDIE